MAKSRVEIEFKAVKAGELKKAINSLDKATKSLLKSQSNLAKEGKKVRDVQEKLTRTTKRTEKGFFELNNSGRLLDNTFATIRSKMLLVSFALSLGVRQLARFTVEASKLDSMQRAFNNLSGGADNASLSIEKLRSATNNTMSDFDLLQQANNALVLGVSKNSDEMSELFDIAQRLGRALGRDTASSVESLVTGIGRQSRLMLDNIGIIVKSEDAYEKFAKANKLVASELTNSQKKQAFFEATMKSARETIEIFGEEVLTSQDKIDGLGASFSNLASAIGSRFLFHLSFVNEGLRELIQNASDFIMPVSRQEKLTQDLAKAQEDLATFQDKLVEQEESMFKGFSKQVEITKQNIRLKEISIEKIKEELKAITDLENKRKEKIDNLKKQRDAEEKATALPNVERPDIPIPSELFDLGDFIDDQNFSKSLEEGIFSGLDVLDDFVKEQDALLQSSENARKKIFGSTVDFQLAELKKLEDAFLISNEHTLESEQFFADERVRIIKEEQEKKIQAQLEGASLFLSSFNSMTGAMEAGIESRKNNELNALRSTAKFQQASAEQRANMEHELNRKFASEEKRLFMLKKMSSMGQVVIDTASAVAEALPNIPLATIVGAMGSAQLATIASEQPPTFQAGGLVGGQRHSQGGTIIEAERGEFVMSRSAVQSIGVETLNQMNANGNTGVTVNISAPLVDETVVDTIIPAIEKATRMNLA